MRKIISVLLVTVLMLAALVGCGGEKNSDSDAGSDATANTNAITVVSREDGSGTRGAFIELFGVEVKNEAGEKEDMTTEEASITNSTSVMMTSVSGNEDAIGYISLGSYNDTVKAVKIDGVEPSVENIKNGSYTIARPFNIVTKSDISATAKDFIQYILSTEGQAVVEDNGYISSEAESFSGASPSGKIVVAGSSSVTPIMEKLKEAYLKINPNATIEIQQSDSTTGVTSAIEGICDIGMASRELKDSEIAQGVSETVIAMDGIAVIVNNNSAVDDLSKEQVRAIFTGEFLTWADIAA